MNLNNYLTKLRSAQSQVECDRLYEQVYEDAKLYQSKEEPEKDILTLLTVLSSDEAPFVKSYSLLFAGAILDAATLSKNIALKIADTLADILDRLIDFDVFDTQNRYVHTFSHAMYLSESLMPSLSNLPQTKEQLIEALLQVYLRGDQPFHANEDLVLAGLLVQFVTDVKAVNAIIAKLAPIPDNPEGVCENLIICESNKRQLWMSLRLLSEDKKSPFLEATQRIRNQTISLLFP